MDRDRDRGNEARPALTIDRQPTISRHIKVLESARLIERSVEGRVHRFRLRREALEQAGSWIQRHQAFWTGAVDQLEQLLKGTD